MFRHVLETNLWLYALRKENALAPYNDQGLVVLSHLSLINCTICGSAGSSVISQSRESNNSGCSDMMQVELESKSNVQCQWAPTIKKICSFHSLGGVSNDSPGVLPTSECHRRHQHKQHGAGAEMQRVTKDRKSIRLKNTGKRVTVANHAGATNGGEWSPSA
ncbi:hypothetical protein BGW36DRAFT_3524 [Talaromyces proteolyticus]|uniref:Uncharacterized protein n=1 Tax=Talaromyces proteolyticus TaxID=1131652 RepID=A0AAD4L2U6_9EURO|nr:uncharacterized protein BGW36DRAFT_3524 [Talaromyces proteolyticus]KAH8704902.1 hypothetical protein BGW36DRAFT_3524 [Talaromyces proteolyticus]